jgi:hypothetical protein
VLVIRLVSISGTKTVIHQGCTTLLYRRLEDELFEYFRIRRELRFRRDRNRCKGSQGCYRQR